MPDKKDSTAARIAEGFSTAGFFDPSWWKWALGGKPKWRHHREKWEIPHFARPSAAEIPSRPGYLGGPYNVTGEYRKLVESPDKPVRVGPTDEVLGAHLTFPPPPQQVPVPPVQVTPNLTLDQIIQFIWQTLYNIFGVPPPPAVALAGAPGIPGPPGVPGAPGGISVGTGGGGSSPSTLGGVAMPYSYSSMLAPLAEGQGGGDIWSTILSTGVQLGGQYLANKLQGSPEAYTATPSGGNGAFVGPVQPGYSAITGLPMNGNGACPVTSAYKSPSAMTARATPQAHVVPNPITGKIQWFVPARITGWKMTHVRRRCRKR